jgi:hypothetical protein
VRGFFGSVHDFDAFRRHHAKPRDLPEEGAPRHSEAYVDAAAMERLHQGECQHRLAGTRGPSNHQGLRVRWLYECLEFGRDSDNGAHESCPPRSFVEFGAAPS